MIDEISYDSRYCEHPELYIAMNKVIRVLNEASTFTELPSKEVKTDSDYCPNEFCYQRSVVDNGCKVFIRPAEICPIRRSYLSMISRRNTKDKCIMQSIDNRLEVGDGSDY